MGVRSVTAVSVVLVAGNKFDTRRMLILLILVLLQALPVSINTDVVDR